MNKLLAIGMAMGLAACGGDSGDGGERVDKILDDVFSHVSITPPDQDTSEPREQFTRTPAGTYETEMTTIRLNGGMSFDSSAACGSHPGLDVTVHNAATDETVGASERVACPLIFRIGKWQSGRLALELGNNQLTASASGDTASITVVRIAVPPTAGAIYPTAGSVAEPMPVNDVRAGFSEAVARSTVNSSSFILEDGSGAVVPGTANTYQRSSFNRGYDGAKFTPTDPLQFATTYTARITTDVTDVHGNAMAREFSWSFTTVADVIPPQRVDEFPAAGSSCAATGDEVLARFDKFLDPATMTTDTFALEDANGTLLDGTVSLWEQSGSGDQFATFTPGTPLDPATAYIAHLNAGITDTAGNALSPSSWSFDTQYVPEGIWTEFEIPDDLIAVWNNSTVWTGTEMIVFGGWDGNSNSVNYRSYDPVLNQWRFISSGGAPSKRSGHSATWTGAEMLIWGGRAQNILFHNDGGRYDPATNSWTAMSTVDAPSARNGHTEVWTGTELIVWGGGRDQNDFTATGGRYNPATDTWTPISTINAPTARWKHHAVFDGERMIIWGGEINDGGVGVTVSDGAVYDPVSDVWTPLPSQNAPDITRSTEIPDSVVRAGSDMLVWSPFREMIADTFDGGFNTETISEARRYDSVNEQWLSVVDACESLATPIAVQLDGRMLSWNEDFSEGYAYDEQRDIWHPITKFPGPPVTHARIISIGDSVIMWDGGTHPVVGYRLEL
jgi:hypothetical protein